MELKLICSKKAYQAALAEVLIRPYRLRREAGEPEAA